jgi:2-oxoglutarate ferredoxin oxidoreductase subunit alpha
VETTLDDADVAIVCYGITSRAAESAAETLRGEGIKAGVLDLKTLWPFPDRVVRELAGKVDLMVVPELNMGQLVREIERAAGGQCPVRALSRIDGNLMAPEQIVKGVKDGLGAMSEGSTGHAAAAGRGKVTR